MTTRTNSSNSGDRGDTRPAAPGSVGADRRERVLVEIELDGFDVAEATLAAPDLDRVAEPPRAVDRYDLPGRPDDLREVQRGEAGPQPTSSSVWPTLKPARRQASRARGRQTRCCSPSLAISSSRVPRT